MKNKQLSERNVHLILDGGRTTGSFEEGYYYKEESMYINEADEILSFCKFLDEVGGCGPINIQGLWSAFNNLEATSYLIDGMLPKEYVNYWKNKFEQIKL